jgi:hypothetical protein
MRRVALVPTRADPRAADPRRTEALPVVGVEPRAAATVASSSVGVADGGAGAAAAGADPPEPVDANPGVPQTSQ